MNKSNKTYVKHLTVDDMTRIADWIDGLNEESAPKITPEMVNAGVLALYAYDNDPLFCSDEERVTAIFQAMVAAASAK